MSTYQETIRRVVADLPPGSRRLPAGEAGAIARAYGLTVPQVRSDAERLAKLRNSGRAF